MELVEKALQVGDAFRPGVHEGVRDEGGEEVGGLDGPKQPAEHIRLGNSGVWVRVERVKGWEGG
jgi:hypothetical protein